jgi:hypothetical protein
MHSIPSSIPARAFATEPPNVLRGEYYLLESTGKFHAPESLRRMPSNGRRSARRETARAFRLRSASACSEASAGRHAPQLPDGRPGGASNHAGYLVGPPRPLGMSAALDGWDAVGHKSQTPRERRYDTLYQTCDMPQGSLRSARGVVETPNCCVSVECGASSTLTVNLIEPTPITSPW